MSRSSKVGSPFYVAPEVLEGSYREHCDIWSLGCVMFVMLFGYPPFDSEDIDGSTIVRQLSGHSETPHIHCCSWGRNLTMYTLHAYTHINSIRISYLHRMHQHGPTFIPDCIVCIIRVAALTARLADIV